MIFDDVEKKKYFQGGGGFFKKKGAIFQETIHPSKLQVDPAKTDGVTPDDVVGPLLKVFNTLRIRKKMRRTQEGGGVLRQFFFLDKGN